MKTFTVRKPPLVTAVGIILLWASMAGAAQPASVAGTWTVIGNQSPGSLTLTQGASATECKPISGTVYPDTPASSAVTGYYCPATGRIAFTRKSSGGIVNQIWVGNLTESGQPSRMGGTVHVVDSGAGGEILGEYNFQGFCSTGTCDSCGPGLTACSDACVDLQNDPLNCGKCGHECGFGSRCVRGACNGACPPKCPTGQVCCPGASGDFGCRKPNFCQ